LCVVKSIPKRRQGINPQADSTDQKSAQIRANQFHDQQAAALKNQTQRRPKTLFSAYSKRTKIQRIRWPE